MVKVSSSKSNNRATFVLLSSSKVSIVSLLRIVLVALGLIALFLYYYAFRSVVLSGALPDVGVGSSGGNAMYTTTNGLVKQQQPIKLSPSTSRISVATKLSSYSSNHNNNNVALPETTIGYVVTVTGCSNSSDLISDAAAVLKHSIHLSSARGTMGGRYDYRMYAFYHPNALKCALPLKDLGYTLLERDTPVAVSDIQGEFLRTKIAENGCCGEKELIKLEAYTLTQHPIVVHLDLDVLILKPMDILFDVMLGKKIQQKSLSNTNNNNSSVNLQQLEVMFPNEPIPDVVEAAFTHDYPMVNRKKHKPVQGGFMVLKPNRSVYEEFRDIIRRGDFRKNGGWGGQMGPFWGSMTFQGIVPYYYNVLHPGRSVELNRCVYNNMGDNPRNKKTVNDVVHGDCLTGEENCEDCRSRPLNEIVSTHYTICQKPWNCLPHTKDMIQHRLCRKLTIEWFRIRSDFEKNVLGLSGLGPALDYRNETFFGYCSQFGSKGYIPLTTTTKTRTMDT